MKELFHFLWKGAQLNLIFSIAISVISGICSVGLVIIIVRSLYSAQFSDWIVILVFFALCCIILLSRSMARYVLVRLTVRAVFDLRKRMIKRIIRSPLIDIEKLGSSNLLVVLTQDISAVASSLPALSAIIANATIIIGCLIYLASISFSGLVIIIVVFAVGFPVYRFFQNRGLMYFVKSREKLDQLFKGFEDAICGLKEIKLSPERRDKQLLRDFETSSRSVFKLSIAGSLNYNFGVSWGQMLFFLCVGIGLIQLSPSDNSQENAMLGYSVVILYMMSPLEIMMNSMATIGHAIVALNRVTTIGAHLNETNQELPESNEPKQPLGFTGLSMRGVSFSYDDDSQGCAFTIPSLDFDLLPGELVFVVGGNGSGKTTFSKLITGLYPTQSGKIFLNGQIVEDNNLEWYRQHFSTVFSDYYLFDKLMSKEGIDIDHHALDCIKYLQLSSIITVENGILSTTKALSNGQKRRVALMTALLEDRPIYIFDEFAADQDPDFRNLFYTSILSTLRKTGKAIIVISHDDRYFHLADRVVKLNHGQIIGGVEVNLRTSTSIQ